MGRQSERDVSEALARLLECRPYLVADGGMATSLFGLGLEAGGSPELWNVEFPDRVASVHQGFVDAGADILLTNTFGGTRHRLKLHGAQDRVAEVNLAAAHLARSVADAAARDIVVVGDIGPTGELFEPLGQLTERDGVAAFAEQARALAEGGVDAIWIETMSSREEIAAAVEGAATTGLPVVCTFTFDTAGRTMMGLAPEETPALCRNLAQPPVALGANCGNGPAELVAALAAVSRAARAGDVLVAKSNCGIPDFVNGRIHYSGTPEVMARYARMARDAGARIIGACCGSTPVHLRAIADALDGYEPGAAPEVAEIEASLGPIAAAAKRRRDAPERARRRRRER